MTWERFAADRAKTEAEIERLQDALEREQREHATCEKVNAQRFQVLTDAIIDLTKQNAAMREIVRVVAEADNSDSGVCYQLCNVRWYGGETDAENMEMRHDAPCIVEQARALFAPGESEA